MGNKVNLNRKDEPENMDINSLLQFLGGFVIAGIVVIGGIISIRYITKRRNDSNRKDKYSERPTPGRELKAARTDSRWEEAKEKEDLADEYCRVTQAIEDIKSEEVYKNIFLRYARVYQILMGLERRLTQNDISNEEFLCEIEVALKNSRIEQQLSSDGFLVEVTPLEIDKNKYRDSCLKQSLDTLRNALAKQRRILAYYQSILDCKGFISETGVQMYSITQEVLCGNIEACKNAISDIRLKLEKHGCFAIYADNSLVDSDENIRVDFLDDTAYATELPGLYTKGKNGGYVLIGTCCGTWRTKNEKF